MAVRQCLVVVTDSRGCRHEVTVTAESLYEAAALALRVFNEQGFTDDGPMGNIEVNVCSPATKHQVPVHRILAWLDSPGRSPKEQVVKARFRGS